MSLPDYDCETRAERAERDAAALLLAVRECFALLQAGERDKAYDLARILVKDADARVRRVTEEIEAGRRLWTKARAVCAALDREGQISNLSTDLAVAVIDYEDAREVYEE